PLAVPALLVARDHARRGEEALADGAAAFLGLPQAAPELVGQPGVFGPVVPAVWLVVGLLVLGDLFDEIFSLEHGTHDDPPCDGAAIVPRVDGLKRAEGCAIRAQSASKPPPMVP